jgi:hypothetical protein
MRSMSRGERSLRSSCLSCIQSNALRQPMDKGKGDVNEADLSRTGKDDQSASRILAPGGSVDTEGKQVGACPKWLRR